MNLLGLTEAHLRDRDDVDKRARLSSSGYGHTNDNTPHPFPNCVVKLIRPDKSTVVGDHTGTSGAVTFFFVFVPSSLFRSFGTARQSRKFSPGLGSPTCRFSVIRQLKSKNQSKIAHVLSNCDFKPSR